MKKINTCVIILASIAFVVLLEFSTVRAQESYRGEVFAGYSSFDDDDDFELKFYGVGGAVYLTEVPTNGHPLAEAAFLERIGLIGAFVEKIKLEADPILKADGLSFTVFATYSKPELPIVLHARLGKASFDYDSPLDGDFEFDTYVFGIGNYFAHGFLVGLEYGHTKSNQDIPVLSVNETRKRDNFEGFVKIVRETGVDTAYNIEGGLRISQFDFPSENGSNTILTIGGDYYFNPGLSLGGGFDINSGDDRSDEGFTLEVDLIAFLNPSLSVDFGYGKFFSDNDEGVDSQFLDLFLSVRF